MAEAAPTSLSACGGKPVVSPDRVCACFSRSFFAMIKGLLLLPPPPLSLMNQRYQHSQARGVAHQQEALDLPGCGLETNQIQSATYGSEQQPPKSCH